jgi:hypothetical protein
VALRRRHQGARALGVAPASLAREGAALGTQNVECPGGRIAAGWVRGRRSFSTPLRSLPSRGLIFVPFFSTTPRS